MKIDAVQAGAAAPILSIESLCVTLASALILDGVSLTVSSGEILGLVGGSGSGKSMTALSVMRLLPARARTSGEVRLSEQLLTGMSESEIQGVRGREIGMVFQEPMTTLNPLRRIGDQVAETVRLHHRVSARQAAEAAREALDRVGFSDAAGALDRYPYQLSGGQRQRVAIAAATVLWPSLLIADEPTTALDAGAGADSAPPGAICARSGAGGDSRQSRSRGDIAGHRSDRRDAGRPDRRAAGDARSHARRASSVHRSAARGGAALPRARVA